MRSKADFAATVRVDRAGTQEVHQNPTRGQPRFLCAAFRRHPMDLGDLGPFDWELVQILRGLVEPTYYTKGGRTVTRSGMKREVGGRRGGGGVPADGDD